MTVKPCRPPSAGFGMASGERRGSFQTGKSPRSRERNTHEMQLAAMALGHHPGRSSEKEVTFFKSVGVAVQDAVAARVALQNAARLHIGTRVNL